MKKLKPTHLIYILLLLEIGCLVCYQFNYFVDRYKLHFNDFDEQYRLLQTITIITILVVCFDLYMRFWWFIIIVFFNSCSSNKPIKNTEIWVKDSVENVEENLYNEWE